MSKLYRVKVIRDTDAVFEESNGKQRPMTPEEYAGNEYRACPHHPRSKVAPQRVENRRAWCGECGTEYADVPYADYRAYQGMPTMHIYLAVIVESLEPPIGDWTPAGSLWNIDCMTDSEEAKRTHRNCWLSVEDASNLPGYLGDVVKEVLQEAAE